MNDGITVKNNEVSKPKTILLVEDEAVIAMSEARMLSRNGYRVITAHRAEQAIDLVGGGGIDLVLMDIDLGNGNMDGTDAAEIILRHREIPIVFLTGHNEREMVEKVKGITRYGYVLKNAGEFVLLESIGMAFELFKAHRETKKSEEELSAIYRHTPVLMVLTEADGTIRKANAFAGRFAGSPAEELIGKRGGEAMRCLHHLDDPRGCGYGPACKDCTIRNAVMQTVTGVSRYEKKKAVLPFAAGGKVKELSFLVSSAPIEQEGEILCLLAVENITDFKDSENKFRNFAENTESMVYRMSLPDGRYEYVNPACERVTGYTREEILEKPLLVRDSLHPDFRSYFAEKWRALLRGECDPYFEYKIIDKAGREKWLYQINRLVKDPSGNPVAFEGVVSDITEKKNYVAELTYLRDIALSLTSSTDRDEILDKILEYSGRIVPFTAVNIMLVVDGILRIVRHRGYDKYGIAQAYDDSVFDLEKLNNIRIIRGTKKALLIPDTSEYPHWHFFPETTWIKSNLCIPVIFEDDLLGIINFDAAEANAFSEEDTHRLEPFAAAVSIALEKALLLEDARREIEERKAAEKNLSRTLKEKEDLMKELNHRVKNNLHMVASLIQLKETALDGKPDLTDLKNQVEAIRIIHEKLNQTEGISHIDLREYFDDLLGTIFSSYTEKPVSLDIRMDSVFLPAEKAVSLGLIVNEIATNAIKHGFNGESRHRFTVELSEERQNGRYVLILSSSGKPFPEGIDPDNPDTLGLRLVSALAGQLDGTFELQKEPHPVFTFRLPVE